MSRQLLVGSAMLAVLALSAFPPLSLAEENRREATTTIHYRTVDVDGLKVFYREAGDPHRPTILLVTRISDIITNVSQPDSAACESLPCCSAGLPRIGRERARTRGI